MDWHFSKPTAWLCALLLACASCVGQPRMSDESRSETSNLQSQSSAREAWNALVANNFERRPQRIGSPALAYWNHVEGLPNVFLYGDSISIDYTETVRTDLAGEANVIRLPANGSHSGTIVEQMNELHAVMTDPELMDRWQFSWDLIHFNSGLHDFKYIGPDGLDKRNGEQVNSVDAYRENLRDAIAHFRQVAPNAQLIFSTTTPVPTGEPGRYVEDAIAYNQAAVSVMNSAGVPIIDLYSFTLPHLESWTIAPGNVHFKDAASRAQGREIARQIRRQLEKTHAPIADGEYQ